MFDFNEIGWLDAVEVEFMVFCVIGATWKIFSIGGEVGAEEIEDFVRDMFFDTTRVTVADLIRKAKENRKIQEFF